LKVRSALAESKADEARKLLDQADDLPKETRARLWHELGDKTNCLKLAKDLLKVSSNQAPVLALTAYLCWESGDTKTATDAFRQLRIISSKFECDSPIFARLSPIAEHLRLPNDWRKAAPKRKDVGKRPSLDSLGPFRWEPYTAPLWTLFDAEHEEVALNDFKGQPVLLVFYLGAGCPHCIEQLGLLAPAAKDFETLGHQRHRPQH
jgi:hypothetical protein